MKFIMFYHSLCSDWNHGNAHFLRGITKELLKKGHDVEVYEAERNWSLANLIEGHGIEKVEDFKSYYPTLIPRFYPSVEEIHLQSILKNADVVIVHEWNPPQLISKLGAYKSKYGYKLLFHDTHHRSITDQNSMEQYDFSNYDGALVFGKIIKQIYDEKHWVQNVWIWHEAADEDLFKPDSEGNKEGDLVWIGNWGDGERTEELMEFLIEPIKELDIKAKVYGVRYPQKAIKLLKDYNIDYGGWLPNYKVPEVFSKYSVTVHIPRRPYVEMLPGIPTIRPFEAMSCGIPLVCSPWSDSEKLFTQGKDYLMAKDGNAMGYRIAEVLKSSQLSQSLSDNGRETILLKHTCGHRVEELERILSQIN